MKKFLLIALFILAGCDKRPVTESTPELQQLQTYFHIPGMAAIVTKGNEVVYENYMGFADLENKVPIDSSTQFQMASLTKMFTGQLILKLNLVDKTFNDSIKIKHVLSHTSQGEPGKHFYYSSRFSWLTKVIEEESSTSFETAMSTLMTGDIFLLNDSTQVNDKLAKPYIYDGEIKPGFIDYGFSASAGVVSTVRDIERFSRSMEIPAFYNRYNYGLFKQDVKGITVFWSYGQYDCYSSLFIKVPSKDLTLVMAANNNLMSDPARMIYGDVTKSLFALWFFNNFLDLDIASEEMQARALAEGFLAVYDPGRAETSKELLRKVLDPADTSLAVLHNLYMLKRIAQHYDQPPFREFDQQFASIGKNILAIDVNNPYANIYMGSYYESINELDSARLYYQRIVSAKNFSRSWYTDEAENWLKQHAVTSIPGMQRRHQE